MLAQIHSFLLRGIDPVGCEVEIDVADRGLAKTMIVGLPDAAVKESLERVRSAIQNSGYPFPMTRMLVNLAPADIKKEGPVYDLPIAVGLLLAQQVISTLRHEKYLFAGELALDGRVRPIKGAINMAILAAKLGMEGVILPPDNAAEAAVVSGVRVVPAETLAQVVGYLNNVSPIAVRETVDVDAMIQQAGAPVDFADVRGQEAAKRALTIAAAGHHNLLMIGPPGSGKTLMAKALPGILPPLTREETLEVSRIYSSLGMIPAGDAVIVTRPVRTPHHTASGVAVIGGGTVPRPGEVSLAHHGILFLDELPEFPRHVLETLRQPLEDGCVTIARAHSALRFPARFMLVGAMNPSPKGYKADDPISQRQMEQYMSKLSGPLIDRIDIHVEVPAVPFRKLTGKANGTDSATIRKQVMAARAKAMGRSGCPNSALTGRQLDAVAATDEQGQELLKHAMNELGLSARAYDKIRRVGRTIADLEGAESVGAGHIAEAVQYRLLDRKQR